MSFGELTIVLVVALVIFGPKELPKVLRKLGEWAGKVRRLAMDLRVQSGIDDALRAEGLHDPIREIQKLTHGELDGVMRAAPLDISLKPRKAPPAPAAPSPDGFEGGEPIDVQRAREMPTIGPDSYGALPDTASAYVELLPRSALADDPLWAEGAERPPAEPETPAAEPSVQRAKIA